MRNARRGGTDGRIGQPAERIGGGPRLQPMNDEDARRLAQALRDELWSTASDELLARLADRGGMKAGLNPPDEIEDEELLDVVWRAVRKAGLADRSASGP